MTESFIGVNIFQREKLTCAHVCLCTVVGVKTSERKKIKSTSIDAQAIEVIVSLYDGCMPTDSFGFVEEFYNSTTKMGLFEDFFILYLICVFS